MASNTFANGSADATITFDKPIGHLLISIDAGADFSFSIDKGANYMDLPAGGANGQFYSFPVGAIKEVRVQASGSWQLIGVQT